MSTNRSLIDLLEDELANGNGPYGIAKALDDAGLAVISTEELNRLKLAEKVANLWLTEMENPCVPQRYLGEKATDIIIAYRASKELVAKGKQSRKT